jgi:hypothetical protein
MQKLLAATAVIAISLVATVNLSPARAACDSSDPIGSCQDAVNDARQKASESASPVAKAQAAGEAVGNCIKCAAESLGNMTKQLSPSGSQPKK